VRALRLVPVALRFDPAHATDLAGFRALIGDLLEREVVAHPTAPTLVALPEHTGLLAMLIGERGAAARDRLAGGASVTDALMALAVAYGEQLGVYAARFPQVTSPGQLLHLAVTDTVVRATVEVIGALAAERGLWISVGTALADHDRVTGQLAAELRAPDVGGEHAYLAVDPRVRNRNLILAPDGSVAAVQDKAYLVPLERDPAGLGLTAIGLDAVTVADLPIGRVASVISKDAWMPDVNDRLDQLGAQVLIQPEAYDRWADVTPVDGPDASPLSVLWPPDNVQRGGWWMVQRHRAPRANVTPMLTGHLAELTFDGQPMVAVPAPDGDPTLGLLGQPRDRGWAAIGRWADLAEPAASLADSARRARFAAIAANAPGWQGAVHADVDLPPASTPGPGVEPPPRWPDRPASAEVAATGLGLVPDLATDGRAVWLAWVGWDTDHAQTVRVARAGSDGSWSPAAVVDGRPRRDTDPFDRRWRPRLGALPDALVGIHLDVGADSWDLVAVRSDDGGRHWSSPVRVDDAERLPGTARERLHDAPALAVDGRTVIAVWSDLRWPWVFPQVRAARSGDGGRTWTPSVRVDGRPSVGEPDPLAGRHPDETRGQTAPAVAAAAGGVVVAWQELGADHVPAIWTVRLDGDGVWSAPERVSGPGAAYRPTLAASGEVVWVAWEQVGRDGSGGVLLRVSTDGGASFGASMPLDPTLPAGAAQRRASVVAAPADGVARPRAFLVAEDDRGGAAIVGCLLGADASRGRLWRIDDAPAAATVRAPAAAWAVDGIAVAWQDTRGGPEHVRAVRLRASV
jgi:predicted amidohydrolase